MVSVPKVKHKPKRKNFRKKAIDLAKQIVREAIGACERCGRDKKAGWQMHGSHILSTKNYGLVAAEIENIQCHCAACHRWWHDNPTEAGEWFKNFAPGRREKLLEIYNERAQNPKLYDWEEVYLKLRIKSRS